MVKLNLHGCLDNKKLAVAVKRSLRFFDTWSRPTSLEYSPLYISFAHELIHAYHSVNGKLLNKLPPQNPHYTNLEEENTIKGVKGYKDYTENDIREEFGLRERQWHYGFLAKLDERRGNGKLMAV